MTGKHFRDSLEFHNLMYSCLLSFDCFTVKNNGSHQLDCKLENINTMAVGLRLRNVCVLKLLKPHNLKLLSTFL